MGRMLRLMTRLSREITAGQPPDFVVLNDISDYLSGFPDECHHPKEDIIFRKLGERDPGLADICTDLEFEHGRLARLTHQFGDLLGEMEGGSNASPDSFVTAINSLTLTYRRHMALEEKHLFPLAIKKLRSEDWDEIHGVIFEKDDPLSDTSSSRFQLLREEISQLANEHKERVRLLGSLGFEMDLESLRTLDQLNTCFEKSNCDFQLSKARNGGYRLTEADEVVLEIPPCSETRAVWSAACFVRACM